MTLEFLGTGTSHGVPVPGCACRVCSSADPRDTRWRSSALVRGDGGEAILIDAGPEFRLQAIRAGITRVDALLVTHAHADHVHGIDDLRALSRQKPVAVVGDADCIEELRVRFSYAFSPRQAGGGVPKLALTAVGPGGFRVGSCLALPVPLLHGTLPVLGWRIGSFAYLTDCSEIPAASYRLLEGISTLVIDGLRSRPHATHFTVQRALEEASRIGARRAFLTHVCHDHSHVELEAICAAAPGACVCAPAYDGLVVDL